LLFYTFLLSESSQQSANPGLPENSHQMVKLKSYANKSRVLNETKSHVTCHMGSHSVTYHPTQVNTASLNPSQTGGYFIYLPHRDGRL